MGIGVRNIVPEYPAKEKTAAFINVEKKKSLRILLLGNGGREHALAWKIAQSEKCEKLFIAPGNAGTSNVGENVPIGVNEFEKLKEFAVDNDINMMVVGPEDPLVKGVYDEFKKDERTAHIPVIGPSKAGAELEGSKDFAKRFMERHNIPTARYKTFDGEHLQEGLDFLETLKAPYVLKADGLCAGKGVLILPTLEEAKKELKEMLGGMFGNASAQVVIEEFLSGIECSVFVLTDGTDYKILPVAKDYKRIGEGDTGLNTGGMGSVSPVPFADDVFMQKVEEADWAVTSDEFCYEAEAMMVRALSYQYYDFGVDWDTIPLKGEHNRLNVKAALCAINAFGVPVDEVLPHLYTFQPLEHRQELVGTFGGVTFYNDSISTIPQATRAALQTIKNVTFLLLGGYDREIDYTPLIDYLKKNPVKHILYTGKAGNRMYEMLQHAGYQGDIKNFKDLNEAFEIIKKLSENGDVCLLSPAAASYDQYRNFEERGRFFKALSKEFVA